MPLYPAQINKREIRNPFAKNYDRPVICQLGLYLVVLSFGVGQEKQSTVAVEI